MKKFVCVLTAVAMLGALALWVMLSSVIHFGLIFVCRVWSETVLPLVKKDLLSTLFWCVV